MCVQCSECFHRWAVCVLSDVFSVADIELSETATLPLSPSPAVCTQLPLPQI